MILFLILLFPLIIIFLVSIYNLFSAPILKDNNAEIIKDELISILIPARNEENNISKCLQSVINQSFKNIEIIVLDDNSTDNTFNIVKNLSYENPQIKLVKGNPLKENWLGKNWACHQLSQVAKGNYLLFLDADVELKKNTISSAFKEVVKNNLDLLSVFPSQKIKSFGEWLIVPLMNWILLALLPLRLIYSSKKKSFVAANGQFMFWNKETYFNIGGHEKVKDKIVEDMELARFAKINNYKIKTFLGGKIVKCRMYNNFKDSFNGFSKNFYPGFNINPFLFLIIITLLTIVFIYPFIGIFTLNFYLINIILIITIRIFISTLSNQNVIINLILHPLQFLLFFFIGINSVIKQKSGKLYWKERNIK